MRRTAILATLVALVVGLNWSFARADEKATTPAPVTNKSCPIMGVDSPVDPTIRLEYEGQYVYFCCKGCLETFQKDPAAAIAKMTPEDREAIKVNTTCPMTGEEITDHNVKVEYQGKLIYFCCAGCKGSFAKAHPDK